MESSTTKEKAEIMKGPIVLLDESLKLFYKKIWTYIVLELIPFIPLLLLAVVVIAFLIGGVGLEITGLIVPQAASFLLTLIFIFLIVLSVLSFIVLQLLSIIGIILITKDNEKDIGLKEIYKAAWKKLLPFLWLAIISYFLLIGAYLFFIIPGILFGIWFFFSTFVLVCEDKRGVKAILKSKEYVHKKWWAVFGRLLFMVFIIGIFAVMLEFGSFVFSFFDFLSFVFSIVVTPILFIYYYLMYEDIKSLKQENLSKKETIWPYLIISILGYLIAVAIISLLAVPFIRTLI